MSTQTIESVPRVPIGTLLLATTALGLTAAAVAYSNVHPALAAIAFWMLAVGLWLSRPKFFQAELAPAGLSMIEPPQEIPYEQMYSLTMAGVPQAPDSDRLRRGPLMLVHGSGNLEIPARLNVPAIDFYRALLQRIPPTGSREVNAKLADYLRQQEATFGADRVATFTARPSLGWRASRRRGRACSLWLLFAGLAWITAAFVVDMSRDARAGWVGFGVLLAAVSLITWLALGQSRKHVPGTVRRWRDASLIVSPPGIAMIQGDLTGQMRWDEIRELRLGPQRRTLGSFDEGLGARGLHVFVEGARIQVADIYDRPLPTVYAVMQSYWRPPDANAA